jgi:hypothetical protein
MRLLWAATKLSGMEFDSVEATFYDDGTVQIHAQRRLTAQEARMIADEAERCAAMYDRAGVDPDRPRYIS